MLKRWIRSGGFRRKKDTEEFGTLCFRCNICGSPCRAKASDLKREGASCSVCSSSVRMRAVMHVLSLALFGRSLALPDFPGRKDIRGIGLSDWEGYAAGLSAKFNYKNTFYHQDPALDIMKPGPDFDGTLDFLISSDVFEHIPPPVSPAFRNSFRMLREGGVLVLTVPYLPRGGTLEHFPRLHNYEIFRKGDAWALRNITKEGEEEIHEDIIFHGGPGSTVEMRLFSGTDLCDELFRAGFRQVHVHGKDMLEYGIYWDISWSLPISARRLSFISEAVDIDLPGGKADIEYAVDRMVQGAEFLEVEGWAFSRQTDQAGARTFITLESEHERHVFSLKAVPRPDVCLHFNRDDVGMSGFLAVIPTGMLGHGRYRIGFLLVSENKVLFRRAHEVYSVDIR